MFEKGIRRSSTGTSPRHEKAERPRQTRYLHIARQYGRTTSTLHLRHQHRESQQPVTTSAQPWTAKCCTQTGGLFLTCRILHVSSLEPGKRLTCNLSLSRRKQNEAGQTCIETLESSHSPISARTANKSGKWVTTAAPAEHLPGETPRVAVAKRKTPSKARAVQRRTKTKIGSLPTHRPP
ncbi:hypothetical protein BT67DRAFT_302422 [Trichocladium antarcticum]|uniref:Uncharacterized protein n=1 Tax=Trichocladium antarcticum TaxID=1450529 RepID=A0AAN6UMY6_9PEZI|nr:hypothetical protein BT67DRAFT_302422 [Trichocladium antarcticum]